MDGQRQSSAPSKQPESSGRNLTEAQKEAVVREMIAEQEKAHESNLEDREKVKVAAINERKPLGEEVAKKVVEEYQVEETREV